MRSSLRVTAAAASLALLVLFAPSALAADGVLEINQTCAAQTGCFSGDTAGFPVTIQASAGAASFRLTSDLTVGTANDTAIRVQVGHVQIDLGGFTIRGPATCSGQPWTCSPTGTGDGIAVSTSGLQAIAVRNGAITGMGQRGVYLSHSAVVENVRTTHNAGIGLLVGYGATVHGVTASYNGSHGIVIDSGVVEDCNALANAGVGLYATGDGSLVGNTSRGNGGAGILAGGGSTVAKNAVRGNGQLGINATYATITDNGVFGNGDHGINCSGSCVVTGNSAGSNGADGTGSGIWCSAGCTVRGNSAAANADYGLLLSSPVSYRENVMHANGTGGVSGGTNQGNNLCSGTGVVSSACP